MPSTYPHIKMSDLKARLASIERDELIIDVRSADEYRSGHVPGSRNIPHDQVAAHAEELKGYKRLYVHCQAGGRAGRASEALARLGLSNLICVSDGGMGDWIAAGYPIEKS